MQRVKSLHLIFVVPEYWSGTGTANGSAPMVLGGSGNVAFPFGGNAGDVPVVGV